MSLDPGPNAARFRRALYVVIFGTDTTAGRAFDLLLLWLILLSVLSVMLESVAAIRIRFGSYLAIGEWFFTVLFTAEYLLRLICVKRPAAYARSFFGLVDLASLIPTYLGALFAGSHMLVVVRGVRLLRVFRVLKLARHSEASRQLLQALRDSWPKISVFLYTVLTLVCVFGTVMYLIEGEENGFTSIPQSIYWAVVTMTTVGYGDIAPKTTLGQAVAATVMILGYAILAVPTGIVTVELSRTLGQGDSPGDKRLCPGCGDERHDRDALFCKYCGSEL